MLLNRIYFPVSLALVLTLGCAPTRRIVQETPHLPAVAPSPTPIPTLAPEAVETSNQPLTLAFTGDIMMGGSAAHKLKTEGPDSFFTFTGPLIKQADLAMGNLEGPLGTGGDKFLGKKYNFLVDPSAAIGLAHAGFKLLTLANNHTMDFGVEALQSTLKALDDQGLQHAGAGLNESEARKPAWFEMKGHKIAVLAYSLTYPTEYWATASRAGCAAASGPDIREDITKARERGADIVVVCCHWGQEKHTRLRAYQPDLAHLAIDAGADAVVCHHPHIWQALETYHGKPIAYAIGNFCFGTLTSISQSGILYLTFGENGRWLGGRITPLNVLNYEVSFAARPMNKKNAEKFYAYLHKLSKNADLKMVGKEIQWKSTDTGSESATQPLPVTSSVSPVGPTPLPTLAVVPTSTQDPKGNPEGSVPGTVKP
jgi:poly-gamma-glutamate capsule biosynthesis protein CapA/YwtB (metallophosphatase superfamily)